MQCKRNKDEQQVSLEAIAFVIQFLTPAPSSPYKQLCTTGLRVRSVVKTQHFVRDYAQSPDWLAVDQIKSLNHLAN